MFLVGEFLSLWVEYVSSWVGEYVSLSLWVIFWVYEFSLWVFEFELIGWWVFEFSLWVWTYKLESYWVYKLRLSCLLVQALYPLALANVSVRVFCVVAHVCVYGRFCFVWFLVKILTLWVPFCPPIARLAANNRFSRRFVLMQKGGNLLMRQNEFLFKVTAICTRFFAICC